MMQQQDGGYQQKKKSFQSFAEVQSPQMQTLLECMAVCACCAKKCLEEGNKTTASLCAECSEICHMAIKALCCHSSFEDQIIELCSNACQKCAAECKKMKANHCQECAEACKQCEEACSGSLSRR